MLLFCVPMNNSTIHRSNPEEDTLMSTPDYQDKIVDGIVNGVNLYCGK